MRAETILWVLVLLALNVLVKKRFPRFYQRLELPMVILFSLLAAGYGAFLLYAAWEVLTSGVSRDDKVFFVGFTSANIAVIAAVVVLAWRGWFQERKKRK